MEVNADMRFSTGDEEDLIRCFPDSAEQIARSMEMTGLQGKLHQAVQTAIARARECSQRSRLVAKIGEVDSADETPPK